MLVVPKKRAGLSDILAIAELFLLPNFQGERYAQHVTRKLLARCQSFQKV